MEPSYFYSGRSLFNLRENCWAARVHACLACFGFVLFLGLRKAGKLKKNKKETAKKGLLWQSVKGYYKGNYRSFTPQLEFAEHLFQKRGCIARVLPSAVACMDILWGRSKPTGEKTLSQVSSQLLSVFSTGICLFGNA